MARAKLSTSPGLKALAKWKGSEYMDVGTPSKELHGILRKRINRVYTEDKLEEALVGFGKDYLLYKRTYYDLSKFPTTWRWGNIKPFPKRLGRVHHTEVRKGKPKLAKGKGRGGFMPRNAKGNPTWFHKHGTQMFERRGDDKTNLRLLLAPSLNMMISEALRSKEVDRFSERLKVRIVRSFE